MENSFLVDQAQVQLSKVKGKKLSLAERSTLAIDLAGILLEEAQRIQTADEKALQNQLAGMMHDPQGKIFTTAITDQCFRSHRLSRIANQIHFIINKYGVPSYFSLFKATALHIFKIFGQFFSPLSVPIIKYMIRKETSHVIIPGEEKPLKKYLDLRQKQNVRINLNHLGEAILGEEEALHRLKIYLKDLAHPQVEYISIKISTLYSQIQLLAWNETLSVIAARLRELYRAAIHNSFVHKNGKKTQKFVNLDMEEYRDLHLTIAVFKKVLSEPEFFNLEAGIVLQSYLPDAYCLQQKLTHWAMQRVSQGGAPIKIRIVKGANLAMEQLESALRLWPQAPYQSKLEVDANYKRMLIYGCQPQHAQAVHLGVASHNLFDIAWGLLLRAENNVENEVGFEMLEGMADHIRRVIQQISGDVLLYSPVATQLEFQNAVAYLVRRLDENTAPQNFLRQAFDLKVGTIEWEKQIKYFSQSCLMMDTVLQRPQRQQNRFQENMCVKPTCFFTNEADTDWSLAVNRTWGELIIKKWQEKPIAPIPIVIAGQQQPFHPEFCARSEDPNQSGNTLYQYTLANQKQIDLALNAAVQVQEQWKKVTPNAKIELLFAIAKNLKKNRAELIGAMVKDTAKTIAEADVEISEAIDFANYYAFNFQEWMSLKDIEWQAKGTILVAPPWNFPCSIPAGGILAALITGNCVLFKPAPEAVLVGWILANIFWEAGVSQEVLQFVNCEDEPIGSQLIQDPKISAVILTGATSTAQSFLRLRPDLDLMAETGGKNTLLITGLADRDLAIKDLIYSAFGHAGQKCSACSLAILEAEVYDDPHFLQQLKDAVKSLHVGSAWNTKTRVNPLIRPANETLLRGLTQLEKGESWLLQPKQDPLNPNLWSPGIKLGVTPNNFTFQNELFGPVLGLVRAISFEDALDLMNQTPYGLTAGIHSLDEREQEKWLKTIVAGNCYINRTITGAIVERQPFGGCKASSFGKGFKAGGPNYLTQFMHAKQRLHLMQKEALSAKVEEFIQAVDLLELLEQSNKLLFLDTCSNYAFYWKHYFLKAHDPSLIRGQDNLQCYVRHEKVTLLVNPEDSEFDLLLEIAAGLTCQTPLEIILPLTFFEKLKKITLPAFININSMSLEEMIKTIQGGQVKRLRLISVPCQEIWEAFACSPCPVNRGPVLTNGRLELLNFLREVSVSRDYHRYGNLGDRENEPRSSLVSSTCSQQKICKPCDCHA